MSQRKQTVDIFLNNLILSLPALLMKKCAKNYVQDNPILMKIVLKKYWKLGKVLRKMQKIDFVFSRIIAETVGLEKKYYYQNQDFFKMSKDMYLKLYIALPCKPSFCEITSIKKYWKLIKLLTELASNNGQSVCSEAKNNKINFLHYIQDFLIKSCYI